MEAAERIKAIQPYYFATKLAEVRGLIAEGKDIINLGIGSPDIDAPEEAIGALIDASKTKGASQYQPYKGIEGLRLAFSEWYSRIYKVTLNPETEILPLIGSKEAIMHIHLAFCNPGDTVLIPNPGYPSYSSSAKILGLNIQEYGLTEETGWMPSIAELESVMHDKVKILWVNYPNMPTGAAGSDEGLKEIIQFAKKHKILLVNDNPYSLVMNDAPRSIHGLAEDNEDVMELNSLSKSHNMSGWRVGVLTGSAENIANVLKVKSNFDSGMYKPIQVAAIEALKLGGDWFESVNAEYGQRRSLVEDILKELGCVYDENQTGMFMWAKVPQTFQSGSEFSDHLLYNYDVFATPGNIFGSNGAGYIRFSLCTNQEELKKVIQRISKS